MTPLQGPLWHRAPPGAMGRMDELLYVLYVLYLLYLFCLPQVYENKGTLKGIDFSGLGNDDESKVACLAVHFKVQ